MFCSSRRLWPRFNFRCLPGLHAFGVLVITVGLRAAAAFGQTPAGSMTCQLSADTAAAGSMVTLDLYLRNASDVRGYQTTLEITRTSGSGELTVACPGGVTVNQSRIDFIFFGLEKASLTPDCANCGVVAPDCGGRRVAAARINGGVNVGTTAQYLATYTLSVSNDATPGSTFAIDILPFSNDPASERSILGASDNSPIPFTVGPSCVLTIEEAFVPIPTLSQWGLIVLVLLLLVGAKIWFKRRVSAGARMTVLILLALFGLSVGVRAAMGGPICASDEVCQDGDVCTFDQCAAGVCVSTLARHGDVAGTGGCGPDGIVGPDDIAAMRNGFANVFAAGCSPRNLDIESVAGCTSDGVIDLFDIFGVASAFSGISKCPCLPPTRDVEPPMDEPCAAPCTSCSSCRQGGDSGGVNSAYLFSGEVYHSAVDLRIPGRGLDFVWCRKYRSKIGPNTAQGNGWDFSYNVYIEAAGDDIVVHDGNTRSDMYTGPVNGPWTRAEFFRELKRNLDYSYTLTFPDTGVWNFHPLNGSLVAGKIAAIADRNGNTLTFAYSLAGRLITITDTLGRDINVAYTGDGHIDSVTDFLNRQVKFAYYQDGDADGSAGDLKSARRPVVTGTPNGNDFPLGKTTVYKYTKGFTDERLNHNLLTITDPRSQVYQVNEYYPATNPHDLNFDRLLRQTLGGMGETNEVVYVPQVPSPANNMATTKAIVNDRVGNVSEHFYDDDNRGVMERDYTGRADTNLPTTDTDNRPTGKLRPSDPDYFETRHEYNDDSLPTRTLHPNGNETIYDYDEDNPSRRSQGNMLEQRRLPGPLGGAPAVIEETYEYDDGFGGCCGTNFIKRHVDPRGNETIHDYDANGNRIHTQHPIPSIEEDYEYNPFGQMTKRVHPDNGSGCRRVDTYEYYEPLDGAQNGHLKREIIDAPAPPSCPGPHFSITTTYEYDAVGNVIRTIDPRGHDSQTIYNPLNQPVRTISREVTDGSGVRYERDTYYDANDNVVRVDVQNKDETGALQPNSHFTTIHEYDILDRPIRTCTESGRFNVPPGQSTCAGLPPAEFITTETDYDANRNPIRQRAGEAVEGRQPDNFTETIYDERDLVFQSVRAPTDPGRSTTVYDYDGNANVSRRTGGIEDALNPRITITEYDGYDRVIRTTDPMGNDSIVDYDPNGNVVRRETKGELNDVPGGAGNVRLSETTYEYDAMDRVIRSNVAFFDTQTQTPIGDGLSTTIIEYTDNSQVKRVVDDNNHQATTVYDTPNRALTITDHKGNTTTVTYDANSNVVTLTELEKSDLGNPDESFTTSYEYDNRDRVVSTTNNVGSKMQYFYDSRANPVRVVDALARESRTDYDGLSRSLRTVRDMDGDGADGDRPDIVTSRAWDDDSRNVGRTDDNGNTTAPEYDALNRKIAIDMADCTEPTKSYDVHHNLIFARDANLTQITYTYDLLDRVISKSVILGPGVSADTTFEAFQYDGLSRLVRAQDNDSLVTRDYDSLSNVTKEVQNQFPPFLPAADRVITSTFDGVGNKLTCTYPGGRIITTTYDELNRKKTITDDDAGPPPPIATYFYIGPGRVERRDYGNGTRTDYEYDGVLPNPPNDFAVKRIIHTKHTRIGDGTVIDDRNFTWDRMGNKTQRKDVRAGGPGLTHDYAYDAVYRLVHTVVTDPLAVVVRDTIYDLDGVGNRLSVTGPGTPDAGNYSLDPILCEPGDKQMNQYTTTPIDARLYDENGNLILIDEPPAGPPTRKEIRYDYRNQMVEYVDFDSGGPMPLVHRYAYDALGRRIRKVVDSTGVAGGPVETRFYLDGWQEIEEQDGAGATVATYTFGLYIDEVLTMRRLFPSPSQGEGQGEGIVPSVASSLRGSVADFFYHTDDLYNVMALSDASGAPVERYEYADYGQPLDPSSLSGFVASSLGNSLLFTGRRYNSESTLYYYRTRYLDPTIGRFTTRDIIGIWGDRRNLGSVYGYLGNNPYSFADPLGLSFLSNFWDSFVDLVVYQMTIVAGVADFVGEAATTIAKVAVEPVLWAFDLGMALADLTMEPDDIAPPWTSALARWYAADTKEITVRVTFAEDGLTELAGFGQYVIAGGPFQVFIGTRTERIPVQGDGSDIDRMVRRIERILEKEQAAEDFWSFWRKTKRVRLGKVIVAGHGMNYGWGNYARVLDITQLQNPNSPQSKSLRRLAPLWSTHRAGIELQTCFPAQGKTGKDFMSELAITGGAPVMGWDDMYEIIPTGTEWTADPTGAPPVQTGDTLRKSQVRRTIEGVQAIIGP